MTPGEAPQAIRAAVQEVVNETTRKALSKSTRISNALRNSAVNVLTNPSPSLPGNPPGIRSGHLRKDWDVLRPNIRQSGRGVRVVAGIVSGMPYATYLEHGTRKMARRPFVDRIYEDVAPEVDTIMSDL